MVQILHLNKFYQKKQVLFDICAEFGKGVTGILGANGAGKTTLFRCIIGTERNQGDICIPGEGKIGYLPQDFDCFHELTVAEAMEYISFLKDADASKNAELLEKVELWQERNVKVGKLSGGMRRRLGIAQAMIGDPALVLMDEPTAGLDPESRLKVRNVIVNMGLEAAILISSHIAPDLDEVADRLVFLKQGHICLSGTKEEILSGMREKVAEVSMSKEEYQSCRPPHTSVHWSKEMAVVRLVGDNVPKENLVSPVLEDAYFYFCGQ